MDTGSPSDSMVAAAALETTRRALADRLARLAVIARARRCDGLATRCSELHADVYRADLARIRKGSSFWVAMADAIEDRLQGIAHPSAARIVGAARGGA